VVGTHCDQQAIVSEVSRKSKSPPSHVALVRIAGLALILAIASWIAYVLGLFDYRHVAEHIASLRHASESPFFIILFLLAFIGATSIGVPAMPFTVAAGVLFGALPGAAVGWVGATLGGAAGYVIARTVGHDTVVRWIKRHRRLDNAIGEARDFRGMLRLRLIPLLPLGAVSFAAGLAKARFAPYFAATAIGVLPITVVYAYFADGIVEGIAGGQRNALVSVVIASALLIGLSRVPKAAKSGFQRAPDQPGPDASFR
jgi:uncharacterized membrane protein YdjX (TVP38/TMEM64 family)